MNQNHRRYEDNDVNKVLKYQADEIKSIQRVDLTETDNNIKETEELLKSLGVHLPTETKNDAVEKKEIKIPTWEELVGEASENVKEDVSLESLFTKEELLEGREAFQKWEDEYNAIHALDKYDVAISACGALLGAALDILLVGIPHKTTDGIEAGPLSNYIRDWFNKKFPEEEMQKLANTKFAKVPYDAQDNRQTLKHVQGLSAYYHRLLSLGHDPLLGFVVGVFDIMTGNMTTIDKDGKIVIQAIAAYADRKETNIFIAIAKQITHMMSDVTTSMGLPAPLMGLFNLLQFGSIGEEGQTIAEIVQGMYYEGYDFIHFCSMSIPVMITEVFVRICYSIKRIKEGYSIKDSIPISLNREKHPKLATMLFIAHSGTVAVNTGKVLFTKNPLSINYPQWIAFAKYSYKQLQWALIEKPVARYMYIEEKIIDEIEDINEEIDSVMEDMSKQFIFTE